MSPIRGVRSSPRRRCRECGVSVTAPNLHRHRGSKACKKNAEERAENAKARAAQAAPPKAVKVECDHRDWTRLAEDIEREEA